MIWIITVTCEFPYNFSDFSTKIICIIKVQYKQIFSINFLFLLRKKLQITYAQANNDLNTSFPNFFFPCSWGNPLAVEQLSTEVYLTLQRTRTWYESVNIFCTLWIMFCVRKKQCEYWIKSLMRSQDIGYRKKARKWKKRCRE